LYPLREKEEIFKKEFTNNQNYGNNLHSQANANYKRWKIVGDKEYEREERGASQPKLKLEKQEQGGPTSLVKKTWSCFGDKKVGQQTWLPTSNGWQTMED